MSTARPMTKSALAVAGQALEAAPAALPAYESKFTKRTYSRAQHGHVTRRSGHRGETRQQLVRQRDEAAEAMAKGGKGKTCPPMPALRALNSPALAELLAGQKGPLRLPKLETVTDDVLKALAAHRGDLDLSGLAGLSAARAKLLASRTGPTSLNGITELAEAVLDGLRLGIVVERIPHARAGDQFPGPILIAVETADHASRIDVAQVGGPVLDTPDERRDLGVRQLLPGRHRQRAGLPHGRDQRAPVRVAVHDRGTAVAAALPAVLGVEAPPALLLVGAVAREALAELQRADSLPKNSALSNGTLSAARDGGSDASSRTVTSVTGGSSSCSTLRLSRLAE